MSQVMAPKRGTFVLLSGAQGVMGERFIQATFAEGLGTNDEFVAHAGPIEITELSENLQTGAISGSWVAADPNVDSWNPATEEGDPAPVGDRVPREPLAAPTITSVTPTYGQNTTYNAPGVKLTLVVSGPDRGDLIWYVRTRPVGVVSWLEQAYPDIDPSPSVILQTDFLPVGELEVEAAYSVGDGRLSPWASEGTVNTDTQLPAALIGLSVSTNEDGSLIASDWFTSQAATSYLLEVIVEEA